MDDIHGTREELIAFINGQTEVINRLRVDVERLRVFVQRCADHTTGWFADDLSRISVEAHIALAAGDKRE